MDYTINGYVVTFDLDTNGNVVSLEFPFSLDMVDNLKLTFAYGVPLAFAQSVAVGVINSYTP